jgi:tRNA modification GTPase
MPTDLSDSRLPTPDSRLPTPDSRYCVLTPSGRGAIATIAVRGAQAIPIVARLFRPASGNPLTDFPVGRTVFGRFMIPLPLGEGGDRRSPGEGRPISEDLVIGLIGQGELEIHCHGGRAAVQAVCAALAAAGAAQITPAAWAHQQHSDPLAADALLALTDARTERTAAILLDQYRGALRRQLAAIGDALAQNELAAAKTAIDSLLSWADFGLHLTQPWKVVLAGRPNAGKSSLMNAILGYERSIVWREPGTTRDVLTATTAIDGWPIELTDTAGLRAVGQTFLSAAANAPSDPIESEGISRAHAQTAAADLVVLVADTAAPWDSALYEEITRSSPRQPLIVHNKCDLSSPPADNRPPGIETSAMTGHGIAQLCQAIANTLVPTRPSRDTGVPFTANQIASLQAVAQHLPAGQLVAARQQLAGLGIHVK